MNLFYQIDSSQLTVWDIVFLGLVTILVLWGLICFVLFKILKTNLSDINDAFTIQANELKGTLHSLEYHQNSSKAWKQKYEEMVTISNGKSRKITELQGTVDMLSKPQDRLVKSIKETPIPNETTKEKFKSHQKSTARTGKTYPRSEAKKKD